MTKSECSDKTLLEIKYVGIKQVFYTAEKTCYQVVCYWQQPWIQVGYNLLLNALTLSLLLQLGDTKPHGNLLLSGSVPGTHCLGHHLLPLKDLALSVICTAGLTGLSEKKKKNKKHSEKC